MSSELTTPQGHTMEAPQQMLARALDAAIAQGNGMEVVKAILDQQKWMILHSEEEAFNDALKRIQKKLQAIKKAGFNKETKSRYAKSEDVHDQIQPHLDEEGMTLNFRPGISDKPDMVLITGVLALGAFSKEYPLEMPADGKGAKGGGVMSRTHATGAAITYAKRYLKDMIFDLRFEGIEDDGNGASGGKNLDDEQFIAFMDNIKAASNEAELKKFYTVAYLAAENLNDWASVQKFKTAKIAKQKEFAA